MKKRYTAPEMMEIEFRSTIAIAASGEPNSAWSGAPCTNCVFSDKPNTKGCEKQWNVSSWTLTC